MTESSHDRRKSHRGRRASITNRHHLVRRRSPTVCRWTAILVVLASMIVVIHAHTPFSSLYEQFNRQGSNTAAIRIGLNKCLDCDQWESCQWGSCPIPISRTAVYAEYLWEALVAFASTFEVLVRGFTLGFGLRMLKYLFFEKGGSTSASSTNRGSVLVSFRRKAMVSAVAGISLAAFLHGSSIFIPAELREEWFAYRQYHHHQDYHEDGRIPDSTIPMTVYEYIRRSMIRQFKDSASGTLECSTSRDNCEISIDWTHYFLGRVGTGLSFLANTLEVLLRGFSLGFGARMLKFLFFPDQEPNRGKNNGNASEQQGDPAGGENQGTREKWEVVQENDDNEEDLLESFQHRALVSAISGVSVAAVVHGSSLFVPTDVREHWFAEGMQSEDLVLVFVQLLCAITIAVIVAKFFSSKPAEARTNSGEISTPISKSNHAFQFGILLLLLYAILLRSIL